MAAEERRDTVGDHHRRRARHGAGLSADQFTFHALRHYCASMLLAEGAPLTALAATVETVSQT
jgi:integrase